MTQEEKAKVYDKFVEELKSKFKDFQVIIHTKNDLEKFFPELAESEDERIRESLLEYLHTLPNHYAHSGVCAPEWIAWLEKQGEPKFKMGDWVIDKQGIVHQIANVIENVTYHTYGYDIVGGGYFNDNTEGVRLWTIADAKDGDVLTYSDSRQHTWLCIFKELKNQRCYDYCSYRNKDEVGFWPRRNWNYDKVLSYKPATKEQRELLFQKMKEAGYEWDAEKKELKKIEQKPIEDVDLPEFESHLCLMFQKFRTKGICTNGEIIDYVKEHSQKLKDILAKPAWSENDSPYYDDISEILINLLHSETTNINKNTIKKDLDWFISLKPKNTWKPSDEQIWALSALANFSESASDACKKTAKELLEQLKKLREE